jgi:hypothetical protein
VFAKVRQRLPASKRATQKFYMGRINLDKQIEVEDEKQY